MQEGVRSAFAVCRRRCIAEGTAHVHAHKSLLEIMESGTEALARELSIGTTLATATYMGTREHEVWALRHRPMSRTPRFLV